MGFLQRRAERRFYRQLDEQNLRIAEATIEFFSTVRELLADPMNEVPEPVCISVAFAHDAPRPAADLCLVGQYVTKIGSNLYGSPAYDMFWDEMLDCSGAWDERIGPEQLQIVTARPRKPTRTYGAKLYEGRSGWIEYTPYDKQGGEGFYAPMAVFALIRVVRAGLGANTESLDNLLDRLATRDSYDPNDTFAQLMQVHDVMQEIGVFDPRQFPPAEVGDVLRGDFRASDTPEPPVT